MRIYVCGSHSTGKTTLARQIAKRTGLPLLCEVARQVLAEREVPFEVLRADLDAVGEYQREIFRRQMEIEDDLGSFVSDRAFDNLAYAGRHTDILPSLLADPQLVDYFDKVRRSIVLFVRPDRSLLVDDGVRETTGWDEVIRIDGIIDWILSWKQIPAVGIAETSIKSRLRTAMAVINAAQNIDSSCGDGCSRLS